MRLPIFCSSVLAFCSFCLVLFLHFFIALKNKEVRRIDTEIGEIVYDVWQFSSYRKYASQHLGCFSLVILVCLEGVARNLHLLFYCGMKGGNRFGQGR